MSSAQTFSQLKELIIRLDIEGVKQATQDALAQGLSPQDIISQGLAKGMEVIGEKFERREVFLPELMISATATKSALSILEPHLIKAGDKGAGKVVVGSAQGDIHDVGKNLLSAVLQGAGFQVFDLGVDVPPDEFAKKAKEVNADVIGISALISGAVSKMAETISLLKDNNIRVKTLVGGAAITQQTAETMGADAYGKDAWEGVRKVQLLMKGGGEK